MILSLYHRTNTTSPSFYGLIISVAVILMMMAHISMADLRAPHTLNFDTRTIPFEGEISYGGIGTSLLFRLTIEGNYIDPQAEVEHINILLYRHDNTLWTNETTLIPESSGIISLEKQNFIIKDEIVFPSDELSLGFNFRGVVTFKKAFDPERHHQLSIQGALYKYEPGAGGASLTNTIRIDYSNKPIPFSQQDSSVSIISSSDDNTNNKFNDNTIYRTTLRIDLVNTIVTPDFISILLSPDWQLELHPDTPLSTCSLSYILPNQSIDSKPYYIYPAQIYNDKNELVIHPRLKYHTYPLPSHTDIIIDPVPVFDINSSIRIECHDIMATYNSMATDKIGQTQAYVEVVSNNLINNNNGIISNINIIHTDNPTRQLYIAGTPFITLSDIGPKEYDPKDIPDTLLPSDSTYNLRYINTQYTLHTLVANNNIETLKHYNVDIMLNGIQYNTIDFDNSIFTVHISCHDMHYPLKQGTIVYPSLRSIMLNAYDNIIINNTNDNKDSILLSIPFINTDLYRISNDDLKQCITNNEHNNTYGEYHITFTSVIKMKDDIKQQYEQDITEMKNNNGSVYGVAGITIALHDNSNQNTDNKQSYYTLVSSSGATLPHLKSPAGDNIRIVFETTGKTDDDKTTIQNGISFKMYNAGRKNTDDTITTTNITTNNANNSITSSSSSSLQAAVTRVYPAQPIQLNHKEPTMAAFHSHATFFPSSCGSIHSTSYQIENKYTASEFGIVCNNALYDNIYPKKLPKQTSNKILIAVTLPHGFSRPTMEQELEQEHRNHHLEPLSSINHRYINNNNLHAVTASSQPAVVFAFFDLPSQLHPNPESPVPDDDSNDNKNKIIIIAAIAAGSLLVIAVAAFFIIRARKNRNIRNISLLDDNTGDYNPIY